jgi:hypothetical protein
MMRRTGTQLLKLPRNLHVAPEYDTWQQKHEAWGHLRKMSKLAGTGYYIPPAWYQHFRMFPPISTNFRQEKTLNPQNASEPTQMERNQLHDDYEKRTRLRLELGSHARSAAATGNRYLNQFWVKKPIDEMEREYYRLTRSSSFSHREAVQFVVRQYHEKKAVQTRVHQIQSEEAKLTGKFITMREAMSVMSLLNTVQSQRLATHQYAEMAREVEAMYVEDPLLQAKVSQRRVEKKSTEPKETPPGEPATSDTTSTPAADGTAKSDVVVAAAEATTGTPSEPSAKAVKVFDDAGDDDGMAIIEDIVVNSTLGDSLPKLREKMLHGIVPDDLDAEAGWYGGFSPEVDNTDAKDPK